MAASSAEMNFKCILLGWKVCFMAYKGWPNIILYFENTAEHFDLLSQSQCTNWENTTAFWPETLISCRLTWSMVKILPEAHRGPETSGMRAQSLVLKFSLLLMLDFILVWVSSNGCVVHWLTSLPLVGLCETCHSCGQVVRQVLEVGTNSHPQTNQPKKTRVKGSP